MTPQSLIKIDRDVGLDVAALFGCAVITGAGAVFNSARVPAGASVAVIGLGGVGLTAVMAAREAGAARIIGVDLLDSKFGLAHRPWAPPTAYWRARRCRPGPGPDPGRRGFLLRSLGPPRCA
ncbi:MAG: hypothetical protein ABWY08_01690 [Comamonas sp.]